MLVATILGSGIVFLDGTVVNVALPRIGHDLPSRLLGTLEAQTYVYNAYLLTLSALLVLAGALSDRYGRRRMFTIGLAGFGLASALCGVAPGIEALIGFRILQGAFGALLVPGSLAILRAAFEGEEQGRAFGLWAAGTSVTTVAGPLLGGVLVDAFTWRLVFLINVPLVLLAIYAAVRHLPESRDEAAAGRFDSLDALLFGVAVGGISFGLIYGGERRWQDPAGYVLVAAGLAAGALLPFTLRRSTHPLVPPALFRSRNFNVVNLATLVVYGALYVTGYYLPLFSQGMLGYSAAAAGLSGLPISLCLILLSPRIGRLSARFGPRPFLVAGPLLMAIGLAWLVRLPQASGAWRLEHGWLPPTGYWIDIFPAVTLFGLGLAALVTPLTTALMGSVSGAQAGVASAFNNAISRVGPQLAGAAIFIGVSAVFFARLGSHPAGVSPLNRPPDPALAGPVLAASTDAFHLAMAVCVLLLLAGAAISLAAEHRPRAAAGAPPSPQRLAQ